MSKMEEREKVGMTTTSVRKAVKRTRLGICFSSMDVNVHPAFRFTKMLQI